VRRKTKETTFVASDTGVSHWDGLGRLGRLAWSLLILCGMPLKLIFQLAGLFDCLFVRVSHHTAKPPENLGPHTTGAQ